MSSTARKPVTSLPAHELQEQLRSGSLTSHQLVEQYLTQIERHNTDGLKLRAIISVCPREIALAQADRLDEERRDGEVRSSLHGLPIILKDAIVTDLALGMPSTAGADVFAHMKAKRNARLVDQLIEAGLIILGKGNLTEFCGQKNNDTPIGWSARGGQTLSVYRRGDLDEKDQPTPGGSSVGPAVSISAGFAPLGVGTETGGSNVFPASVNGLYGLTFTRGSVPSEGVQKLSDTWDRIGIMARSPADLAGLAPVMLTKEAAEKIPDGGYEASVRQGWGGLAVGMVNVTWGIHPNWAEGKWETPEVSGTYSALARKLEKAGARVVYPFDAPDPKLVKRGEADIKAIAYHEFPTEIKKFLTNFEPDPRVTSLADIITWNEEHASEAMPEPHPGQSELIASRDETLSDEDNAAAVSAIRQLALEGEGGMSRAMADQGLDLVVSASDASLVSWAAAAGWPIATVPVSRAPKNGQPWGVFVLARAGREDLLLRFCQAAWQALDVPEGPSGVF